MHPFDSLQNFKLVQIESICRRQNKCNPNIEICFENGRKHCGKRRKCWLPAFSPFPTILSKAFFLRVVKMSGFCGKELIQHNLFLTIKKKKEKEKAPA